MTMQDFLLTISRVDITNHYVRKVQYQLL